MERNIALSVRPARPRMGMWKQEAMWFYILASPWILGFLIFTLYPMVSSLYLSFTNWDLLSPAKAVGLDNYRQLFFDDPLFRQSLVNTFYFAGLSVPLSLLVSLWLASILNQRVIGMGIFRTIFYLPSLVPLVATSLLFSSLFAPTTGLINRGLALVGITGPAWLLDASWVIPALVLMSLWGLGGGTVLLLAGMRGIPRELYEAAAIDGAAERQVFWRITVPMLTPILFFNLVISVIGGLQTFTQVYILTKGGPDNASSMLVPYLFDTAFRYYKMGYASAMAWVLFFIILALTALVFRSSSLWVFYESEARK
ncbi:MAG: carbohydrate ABC transporter permease [Deinococcus sp.]